MQSKCDLQYDLSLWYSHGHSTGQSLFLRRGSSDWLLPSMLHSDPPVASVHLAKQTSRCMVNDNHILHRNACMAHKATLMSSRLDAACTFSSEIFQAVCATLCLNAMHAEPKCHATCEAKCMYYRSSPLVILTQNWRSGWTPRIVHRHSYAIAALLGVENCRVAV